MIAAVCHGEQMARESQECGPPCTPVCFGHVASCTCGRRYEAFACVSGGLGLGRSRGGRERVFRGQKWGAGSGGLLRSPFPRVASRIDPQDEAFPFRSASPVLSLSCHVVFDVEMLGRRLWALRGRRFLRTRARARLPTPVETGTGALSPTPPHRNSPSLLRSALCWVLRGLSPASFAPAPVFLCLCWLIGSEEFGACRTHWSGWGFERRTQKGWGAAVASAVVTRWGGAWWGRASSIARCSTLDNSVWSWKGSSGLEVGDCAAARSGCAHARRCAASHLGRGQPLGLGRGLLGGAAGMRVVRECWGAR